MPQDRNSFVDDLEELGRAALPYVGLVALMAGTAGFAAYATRAAETGAAISGETSLFSLARLQAAKVGAGWASKDLPQQIAPYVKKLIANYGQPAAKAVLNDLKDIPLTQLTVSDLKASVVKRFGAASEKAIFKESQKGIKHWIANVKANPSAQKSYVNFLLNKTERAQMIENANRRVAFTVKKYETLGSNNLTNRTIRTVKRANRTIFDYGISPKTIPQRFINSYAKGFVRATSSHAGTQILTTIPGKKVFLIRKYIGSYRRYTSERLLFGKPGKTRQEIGQQLVKYIANNQAWTPEILGQASGYASGSIFYMEVVKQAKSRKTNNNKKKTTVQVHSYYRNGKKVQGYTRSVPVR